MKNSSPYQYRFLKGALSVFDIGAILEENNEAPLTQGLESDMQQLSKDQYVLTADYKKASDKMVQEIFGE